ncbi:MAG: hypothetical protein J6B25_03020 [Clostridia bacterium]|nr:hypothetical protein [Clostridia bacterium]
MAQHDKNKSLIAFATAIIIPCVVLTLCAVLFININESKKREQTASQPHEEPYGMVDGYSIPEDAMYLWQYDWDEIKDESTSGNVGDNTSESATEYTVDPELSSLLMLGDEEITDIMQDIYDNIIPYEEMSKMREEITTDIFNGETVVAKKLLNNENCIGATIYIKGEYTASTFGVLTVKIKETGFPAPQHKFLYDLAIGMCTDTDKSDKSRDMSVVKTGNGMTVVTVMFPPDKCLPVSQISKIDIESSYSLFRDINGEKLEVFNVSAS